MMWICGFTFCGLIVFIFKITVNLIKNLSSNVRISIIITVNHDVDKKIWSNTWVFPEIDTKF
jgi:hypothetical protein